MNLYLEKPLFLLVILVGVALVWRWVRHQIKVGYSQKELLAGMGNVPLNLVQKILLPLAVILLGLALAQPMRNTATAVPVYVQARDIVISLDISGSMGSATPVGGNATGKLVRAKRVIEEFVMARPQDRIALVTFDTRADLKAALTIDQFAFLAQLKKSGGGGGTEIGIGLITALEQLALFGNQGGAVILLSDGVSGVKPEEVAEIERLLVQSNPHLYWILIGDPNHVLTVNFRQRVEGWGGKVYLTSAAELQEVFNEISQLESSPVVYEQNATARVEFGPWLFILAGFLALASLIEITKEV